MNECNVLEGVIVGATGGALAGISLYAIQYAHQIFRDYFEAKHIRDWLKKNTQKDNFRSTRTIASWTNLSIERVQYLCSHDKKVKLSTGQRDDMWALREKLTPDATFE